MGTFVQMVTLIACCGCLGLASTFAGELPPLELERLPLGSIRPEGWLKLQIERMAEDGICGRLNEYGRFLNLTNGWISCEERGVFDQERHFSVGTGWEEQPYWFRSFVKLAVLSGNERTLAIARDWVEKILATARSDGWYGPEPLRKVLLEDGTFFCDIWGHMIMCEALLSWHDYSHDGRILELLSRFVDFCLAIPDDRFLKTTHLKWDLKKASWLPCIQQMRAGDMISTLFRLYDASGRDSYLALADRIWRVYYEKPVSLFLDRHNVMFCQRFSYPSIYARRTGDLALAEESEYWLRQHGLTWGQMPRWCFAADEQVRSGCTDPRYGLESCSWAEYVRSFQNLADWRGETKWADRTEDVVFNHAPCAYTPDLRGVHYITACNQVVIDARTDHDYYNQPQMIAYSSTDYRCCLYNAALTMPLFAETLVRRARDGALYFWMYAPCSGSADGVKWKLETCYPFRETGVLTVSAERPMCLRFRVPGWAKGFRVGKSDAKTGVQTLDVHVPAGCSVLPIEMKAELVFTPWARQNGVSVDRGPLTYSVAIGERYVRVVRAKGKSGNAAWNEVSDEEAKKEHSYTEIWPTTPWNYGIDVRENPEWRECKWTDDCFVSSNAVSEVWVTCRRLKEWTLQDNQPARLQLSPALTCEPCERIRFTPLGCQRLRLSVLPQVTDNPRIGYKWTIPPAQTKRENRVRDCNVW